MADVVIITVTAPEEHKDKIIKGIAKHFNYQEVIRNPDHSRAIAGSQPMIPNPESQEDFVNRMYKEIAMNTARRINIKEKEKSQKIKADF